MKENCKLAFNRPISVLCQNHCGHDNWNGGIDYYNLKLYLDYNEFSKVVSKKKEYEDAIEASLHSFYNDDGRNQFGTR